MANYGVLSRKWSLLSGARHKIVAGIFVAAFAGVGVYLIAFSHAATPVVSVAASSGTLSSGAGVISDSTAYDGQAVKFGQTVSNSMAIHVDGDHLVNGNGQMVVLRGVDRSGSEYMCTGNWGIFAGNNVLNDDGELSAMKTWGINAVNIGLNEDCWLNVNDSGIDTAYVGTNYIDAIKHDVSTAESDGITPIITLFWMAPGNNLATNQQSQSGQASMPDNDHAPALWQSVAETFKNDPDVIFRLKEEPYPDGDQETDAAWNCWLNGDYQYDTSNTLVPVSHNVSCNESYQTASGTDVPYSVVGMQSLINIIRGTGATNVIQVPGVEYADSMQVQNSDGSTTPVIDTSYWPHDTLTSPQLMGAVDVYPEGTNCNDVGCYNAEYLPMLQKIPFIAGETAEDTYGNVCDPSTGTNCDMSAENTFLDWMDSNDSGYLAWTWDTWGGNYQLISSYGTGDPESPWGTDYQAHLKSLGL